MFTLTGDPHHDENIKSEPRKTLFVARLVRLHRVLLLTVTGIRDYRGWLEARV